MQSNTYSAIPFLLKKKISKHTKNKTMFLYMYRYKCVCTLRERSGTIHIKIITVFTSVGKRSGLGRERGDLSLVCIVGMFLTRMHSYIICVIKNK